MATTAPLLPTNRRPALRCATSCRSGGLPQLPTRQRARPAPCSRAPLVAFCAAAGGWSAPEAGATAAGPRAVHSALRQHQQQQQQQQQLGRNQEQQWQQQQMDALLRGSGNRVTAAAAPAKAPAPPPFAALRLLLTGPSAAGNPLLRQGLGRNSATARSGPISLLLFVLTLIAACMAALRSAVVRRAKACRACRGFGVQRCRLCNGAGRVDWAAKLSHACLCPLCMNRRYVVCADCGGHYHRPIFRHMRRANLGAEVGAPYAADGAAAAFGGRDGSATPAVASTLND